MSEPAVVVDQLSKTYVVPVRGSGLSAALKSLVRRQTRAVEAVRQVSFTVGAGEVVGFLGPNGAGKTPRSRCSPACSIPARVRPTCWASCPHRRDRAYLRQITLVMGQRNQLIWDEHRWG
jgi:ABC-2 type transport system ATP-binding protein